MPCRYLLISIQGYSAKYPKYAQTAKRLIVSGKDDDCTSSDMGSGEGMLLTSDATVWCCIFCNILSIFFFTSVVVVYFMQGGEEQGGMRFYAPSAMRSVKDIASFTENKYRQIGQGASKELEGRDFKAELDIREKKHFLKSSKEQFLKDKEEDLKLLEMGLDAQKDIRSLTPKEIDADEEVESDEDKSEESDDDSETSDDEEELLARELERIREERAKEAALKAQIEAEEAEKRERVEALGGNPLLQGKLAGAFGADTTFAVKRRWDDDVVFKNQSRTERKQPRRFINDTIRSDFHRRFLERYMK